MNHNLFQHRHIGPDPDEQAQMLDDLGVASLEELMQQTLPADIRLHDPLDLPDPLSEAEFLQHMRQLAAQNRCLKTYIGMGYHDCLTPAVIQRNIFENPAWYTPYTPYQAEIAQGRLESLMNFQTLVADLTGMDVANASLLDEAIAAAEAMTLLYRIANRKRSTTGDRNQFVVVGPCLPQTLAVLRTRAEPLGIELLESDSDTVLAGENVFGWLISYPDDHGRIDDWRERVDMAHAAGIRVAVASDLLALTLLTPPGEWGADIVFGSAQRLGVPMGYGGPHAAFFAVRDELKREIPGRVVGMSVSRDGSPAYRLALQTREQHIRREKATSNICTSQALLANMAAMYAVYHGPDGLRQIASTIHSHAVTLRDHLTRIGIIVGPAHFFDTLYIPTPAAAQIHQAAREAGLNLRLYPESAIGISFHEMTSASDVDALVSVFKEHSGSGGESAKTEAAEAIPVALQRTSPFMTHEVFHKYRTETELIRYIKQLERRDIGLNTSMIPLGSCTMKLNAAVEMTAVSWPEFASIHPYAPIDQATGYHQMLEDLTAYLRCMTGLDEVSLQPNSGAQGEYAGLLAIRAWHQARGEGHRHVVLIPTSAHGTNPASAVLAGMEVVLVNCNDEGRVDWDDLTAKVEQYRSDLSSLMITYPSTFGVFEERICEMCELIHAAGGQVYMDGANLNAQVGLTSPGKIGADVCHMNLHKTFSIPHGGGGPGMGPIAVRQHLAPYLPQHPLETDGGQVVSASPYGSASILLISYAYVRLLGAEGVTQASRVAILNANYIKHRLEPFFAVEYSGAAGRVAHELIFDCRSFRERAGITEEDVAKRLMDYGYHAPTVSWPVPGTMMIEPTESESKQELDRFCDALIAIHGEIEAIASGEMDRTSNPLRNAPHPAATVCSDEWDYPYRREQAAYPLPYVRENKYWPPVSRIDGPHGDRHFVPRHP